MLFYSRLPYFFLGTFPNTASKVVAAPVVPLFGSTHNLYLVSCVPRSRRDPPTEQNFTAIAYFRNPITNNATEDNGRNRGLRPDRSALVSDPPEPWEGVKWRVEVWRDKTFMSEIPENGLDKLRGDLAGTAAVGEEEYACFRDGETRIRVRNRNINRGSPGDDDDMEGLAARGNCVADYGCGSLKIGNDED